MSDSSNDATATSRVKEVAPPRVGNGNWKPETWEKIAEYTPRLLAEYERRNAHAADDAIQQIWLKLLKAEKNGLDEPRYVPALMQTIGNREELMRRRKDWVPKTSIPRYVRFLNDIPPDYIRSEEDGSYERKQSVVRTNLDAALQLEEVYKEILKQTRGKKDTYLKVFETRFIEGHDNKETARILGMSEGAVKSTVHRLRDMLEPYAKANGFWTPVGERETR